MKRPTPSSSAIRSAFPQARVLGLVECGTHAVVAAGIAPYRRSEIAMATELLPAQLKPDMLVLADRNFYSFKLWQATCATGAKLVWRVKSTLGLPVEQPLRDGSYLSTVFDSGNRARRLGQTVRVIDYTLQDSATPMQDSYRLVTNILGPGAGVGRAVPRALGDRGRLRRIQDPPALQQHRPAQQNADAGAARAVGLAAGAFHDSPTHWWVKGLKG